MDGNSKKPSGGKPVQTDAERNKVMAEREARRIAKQSAKQKLQDKSRDLPQLANENVAKATAQVPTLKTSPVNKKSMESSSSTSKAERRKEKKLSENETKQSKTNQITEKIEKLVISESNSSQVVNATEPKTAKPLTKAERRAIQEAQRAAKAAKVEGNVPKVNSTKKTTSTSATKKVIGKDQKSPIHKEPVVKKSGSAIVHRVKLFNHLYTEESDLASNFLNSSTIHPSIVRLGTQYASGVVKGSNARCLAFMNAIKIVIQEYETPSQKEFGRGLEEALKPCTEYLQQCRPLAVSITNAIKYIKWQITKLPQDESDDKLKFRLLESIDTYIRDQIDKAAEAISITVQEKISDGDVILTFGCSSVVQNILNEAKKSKRDFRVIVVDARPWNEGQEMLRRLVAKDIKCTCVLINAVGFIMPEVTKVLLGAHALLANGYVMSRTGTAQVALIANSYNVPVLVCCETHKFSERVQTDAFVHNEIGNPFDLVATKDVQPSPLSNWKSIANLTPLNLCYDVTPPELVSAVVTEVAILPCTSVPVILRIKPSEIGY